MTVGSYLGQIKRLVADAEGRVRAPGLVEVVEAFHEFAQVVFQGEVVRTPIEWILDLRRGLVGGKETKCDEETCFYKGTGDIGDMGQWAVGSGQ